MAISFRRYTSLSAQTPAKSSPAVVMYTVEIREVKTVSSKQNLENM